MVERLYNLDLVIKQGLLAKNVMDNGRKITFGQNFKTLLDNSDSRHFRTPKTVKTRFQHSSLNRDLEQ